MKVLDHVPLTMHNFVTEAFKTLYMGHPTDHYSKHKIEAHLLISGLYDDVYIEWVMGHGGLDYGYELPYYWPEATRELEKFSFEVYRGSLENPQARLHLREFIDDLTM